MTPRDITERHLNLWFADGVSRPGDGKKTLAERVEDAICEALEDIRHEDLAGEVRRLNDDVLAFSLANTDLYRQLREMTQARDDAVEAARIAVEDSRRMDCLERHAMGGFAWGGNVNNHSPLTRWGIDRVREHTQSL